MNSGMNHKACLIHRVSRRFNDFPVNVNLDQIGGGHFIVVQSIGVDKKMRLGPRDMGSQMAVDQLTPAKIIDQPIGSRKIDP